MQYHWRDGVLLIGLMFVSKKLLFKQIQCHTHKTDIKCCQDKPLDYALYVINCNKYIKGVLNIDFKLYN